VTRAAAVVFDCDGTLVDSEPLSRRAWEHELGARGYTVTDEDYAAVLGRTFERTHAYFAQRVELPEVAEFWPFISSTLFQLIDDELVPFDDALETVAALHADGVTVAVASSSPRVRLDRTLLRAGLQATFDVTVAGDEVVHGKPAPDMYVEAAARLGVAAGDCIAVEDTATGVEAALRAGMKVVGIARSDGDHTLLRDADVVLDRLSAGAVLAAAA
jgi:HAD superfamily hydrolase (TIGR01509 family)